MITRNNRHHNVPNVVKLNFNTSLPTNQASAMCPSQLSLRRGKRFRFLPHQNAQPPKIPSRKPSPYNHPLRICLRHQPLLVPPRHRQHEAHSSCRARACAHPDQVCLSRVLSLYICVIVTRKWRENISLFIKLGNNFAGILD